MPMTNDALLHEGLMADIAQATATAFEERHLALASPAARAEIRLTIVALVTSSILAYIDRLAAIARSN